MKQRVRKLIEYTWADPLGYAVIGTPNLLEYDQGFFVKGGDGARRRQADRAPLQDPGVRARAPPRPAAGDRRARRRRPRPSAFRRRRRSSTSAIRTTAWTCCCGGDDRASRPPSSRRASAWTPTASRAPTARSTARRIATRVPARAARVASTVEPGRPLTCAASPASCTPIQGAPGRRARRCAAWRARSAIAGPTATASRSAAAPGLGLDAAGDLRHPGRLAAAADADARRP